MSMRRTSKALVSGYRFAYRRLADALRGGSGQLREDPLRTQARVLALGVAAAVLALGIAGLFALLHPKPKLQDGMIVMSRQTGAMYVLLNSVAHPVLNLASARLVLGNPADPVVADDREIARRPRGGLLGIAGAPVSLPVTASVARTWTICDRDDPRTGLLVATSLIAGPASPHVRDVADQSGLLVRSEDETIFALVNGRRARVDAQDRAVYEVFALGAAPIRKMSASVLNAIPEAEPFVVPRIVRAGERPGFDFEYPIGAVVATARGTALQYFTVLADGLQAIPASAAELLRAANSFGVSEIPRLPPDHVTRAPKVSGRLGVDSFPAAVPRWIDTPDAPVACVQWHSGSVDSADIDTGAASRVQILVAASPPIPAGGAEVEVAQRDGPGPRVDAVFLPPQSGVYVPAAGLLGQSEGSGRFYVNDAGVRFGIADDQAAQALGLTGPAVSVPWQVLSTLADGPTLDIAAARTTHDGISPDPGARPLPPAAGNP